MPLARSAASAVRRGSSLVGRQYAWRGAPGDAVRGSPDGLFHAGERVLAMRRCTIFGNCPGLEGEIVRVARSGEEPAGHALKLSSVSPTIQRLSQ